jgi:hypothetical protein
MNPWKNFEPASCFPDDCNCEGIRDAFIRQPSAFWSSFAYIFAAMAIFRYIKNKGTELRLWTGVCTLLGLSSLFGHGSFTQLALAMDFASIILVLSFFALLNLFLLLKLSTVKILCFFSSYYVALFFMMYVMDKWAKIGICVLIFALSMADLVRELGPKFLQAKSLQISLIVLGFSFVAFLIDEAHVMCDPYSLWQWHSLWHLGTATAIFFYGKWRFDESKSELF